MDTATLILGILAVSLAAATWQAWHLGHERRDVALLGGFGALLGAGATATSLL